jgi:hypothetical protein
VFTAKKLLDDGDSLTLPAENLRRVKLRAGWFN